MGVWGLHCAETYRQGGPILAETPRVLLYIAADDPHDSNAAAWLTQLEEAGINVARATGHEAGRFALQSGDVAVLVLDDALGMTPCAYLLREGRARNAMDAAFVVSNGGSSLDEEALANAGVSRVCSLDELASLDLTRYFPRPETDDVRTEPARSAADARAFMARISHEIRTPLHGIHGAMDLLNDTGMTPLQQNYVEIVRNAADALMSVVNDLIDYSNPPKLQCDDESFPFEPRTCAERVASIMGPKALAKGLDFVHLTHHDVPWRVVGNPNQLRQVLNGLAGHLIRHNGSGTVVLEIATLNPAQGALNLSFRIGIEAAEFGPDALHGQEANAYAPDESDVSLERCAELAAQFGGKLQTRTSSTGTMQFEFSAAFEALPDKIPLHAIDPEALEGREVLIVDDTATNRMVYREQLANWGCEFAEASNGSEALELICTRAARGGSYDIALVDFAMPDMDGAALATAIRAMPQGAKLRLVLCTSMPKGGDAARMTDAGFDAYLTKPIRFDCLRKVMGLLLGDHDVEPDRTPLITQHVIAEMDRAARSTLYIGDATGGGHDAIAALQTHGFPCDTARLDEDAVRALSSHPYAALLVDCRSSLDEGVAVAERIRATESSKAIPLFMILRHADVDRQAACLAAGGDVVLVEPIQRDELVSMLNTYLGLEEPESVGESFDGWDMGDPIAEDIDSPEAPVDMNRLDEVTAGDAELRHELIEMFLSDTEQRFAVIDSAIVDENGDVLNRTAHSIKGSSANMGASTLQSLAFELESLGAENRFDEAAPLFSKLKSEFEAVKAFFGSVQALD